MNTQNFTPQESLQLIEKVIKDARNRFEENGNTYIFWGILIAISSFGQFYLLQAGHYKINWYPYLIMLVGGLLTYIYFAQKERKQVNPLGRISGVLWFFTALNIMVLAFAFSHLLKQNLAPLILILLAIAVCTASGIVRSRLLLFSGIVINIAGLGCFFLAWEYQSLVMGITGVVAVLLPGLVLRFQKGRKNV